MSMRIAFFLLIVCISVPARAQLERVLPTVSFSAVAVRQVGAMEVKQRIHYSDGRLRIDGADGFATTILDLRTESQLLLMANHTYIVLPLDDELYRRFFPFRYAKRLKPDAVAGRTATKYVFDHDGALDAGGYYWLTPDGIMLRCTYVTGVYGMEHRHSDSLTDVKIGSVPASLFTVPPGYRQVR